MWNSFKRTATLQQLRQNIVNGIRKQKRRKTKMTK